MELQDHFACPRRSPFASSSAVQADTSVSHYPPARWRHRFWRDRHRTRLARYAGRGRNRLINSTFSGGDARATLGVAYRCSLPSGRGPRESSRVTDHDLVLYSTYADRLGILTGNATTPYLMNFFDPRPQRSGWLSNERSTAPSICTSAPTPRAGFEDNCANDPQVSLVLLPAALRTT